MIDKRFKGFDNFLFDLDGTIWLWTELLPRVDKVMKTLEELGKNIFFLTNNCLLTRTGFARKLQSFGIKTEKEKIINPTLAAIKLFKGKTVYCIGEGIVTELRRAGVKVKEKANNVLVSDDRKITYDKLARACNLVEDGANFYKTASGGIWVVKGKRLPGTGAIASVIELTIGKKAEVIGKPSKHMLNVLDSFKFNPAKTILFGDECDSDIRVGNILDFKTVLVLTGKHKERDYLMARGFEKPDILLRSVANILK